MVALGIPYPILQVSPSVQQHSVGFSCSAYKLTLEKKKRKEKKSNRCPEGNGKRLAVDKTGVIFIETFYV